MIQIYFLVYEIFQFINDKWEYVMDLLNYLELLGIICYALGAVLDSINQEMTDLLKTVLSFSVILTLIKLLYLIRVFKKLIFW